MKKLNFPVFLLMVPMLYVSSCCTPNATIGSQPVTLKAQETEFWCWAASGQMCMNFLGANIQQCVEANKRFGRTDCCNSPVPTECVNGGWPEFEKYGFSADVTSEAPLSYDEIKKQIYCYKKPIAFSWHWNGGGGHMMVITGYFEMNGVKYLTINNPWAPNVGAQEIYTYENYVSGLDHTHWNDYYNITKN